LIREFVDQNQRENLGSKENPLNAEMNDTIVFTTKSVGNLDPTFTRDAIPGSFVPSEIKLRSDNYRLDMHTIIVLMPTYSPSKIRTAFEILQRSGRLDEVEKKLAGANFNVTLSEEAAKALAAELVAALGELKDRDNGFFSQVLAGRDFEVMVSSPDCPC
jgi:hypothetical protein